MENLASLRMLTAQQSLMQVIVKIHITRLTPRIGEIFDTFNSISSLVFLPVAFEVEIWCQRGTFLSGSDV
jgi:hypothetical protein